MFITANVLKAVEKLRKLSSCFFKKANVKREKRVYLFTKYLLNSYYESGIVPGTVGRELFHCCWFTMRATFSVTKLNLRVECTLHAWHCPKNTG